MFEHRPRDLVRRPASDFDAVACTEPASGRSIPMIRRIAACTPGGANGVVTREIANGLQACFNQIAIVENMPGGGAIAYSYAAKSPLEFFYF